MMAVAIRRPTEGSKLRGQYTHPAYTIAAQAKVPTKSRRAFTGFLMRHLLMSAFIQNA
jgi:hypothetical protein